MALGLRVEALLAEMLLVPQRKPAAYSCASLRRVLLLDKRKLAAVRLRLAQTANFGFWERLMGWVYSRRGMLCMTSSD